MKVLILSDGIPGHFNQSRGVALLLGENILLNEEVKNLEPKIRLLRSPIKLLARYLCKDLTKFKAQIILNLFKSIDSSNIKLIIAAGGNTAAYSAALSLLTAIPNIQLGSPRGIHSNNFDVHLTIERYFDTPNNLVLDITPNLYSPEICKDASNDKASNNSALLLIGGQGIGYSYEVNEWNQLIQNIINRNLRLSSRLLGSHGQMIRLIHGILVLFLLSLFLITVFYYLVHLNLVSHASRRLRNVMWMTCLALVDVILTSS